MFKEVRYIIEFLLVKSLLILVSFFPYFLIKYLAKFLGSLAYYFDFRGRKTALENIRVVFGDKYNQEERGGIVKNSYEYFALTFLELFWSNNLNQNNYTDYIDFKFEDEEHYLRAVKGKSILLTMHYGNFEWLSYVWGLRGNKIQIIAQDFKNKRLTKLFHKLRSGSNHNFISSKYAFVKNYKRMILGKPVAFLSDLSTSPNKSSCVIECFGLKTCTTALHAHLIKKTNAEIIQCIAIPPLNGFGKHTFVHLKPFKVNLNMDINEITQLCWNNFEKFIKDNPAPWMWMYKHWRYLPKGSDEFKYPDYSNINHRFEKILKKPK